MPRMLERAIRDAGLEDVMARLLRGELLFSADRAALEAADVLVVAGLADRVRRHFLGDEVQLFEGDPGRYGVAVVDATLDLSVPGAPTGQEALKAIAIARLMTPIRHDLGVCWDKLGFELAQTSLVFGVNVLWGRLARTGSLPLVEQGQAARRGAVSGLVERAGRRPRWHEGALVRAGERAAPAAGEAPRAGESP